MAGEYKIKKVSAADQVYSRLRQLIIDETWKAGEKLPTEGQLAEEFAVNRLTVRVALQRLQAIGLLDIRVGSGTYVKEFDMCGNIEELSQFYTNTMDAQDAREYRYMIETACVRLAVDRRTDQDLAAYWKQYKQMEEHVSCCCQTGSPTVADWEVIAQTDMSLEIHAIICAMAHNELLNYAFTLSKAPIRQLMLRNVLRRTQDLEMAINWVREYARLYELIRDQDREGSLTCVRHIMDIDLPYEQ